MNLFARLQPTRIPRRRTSSGLRRSMNPFRLAERRSAKGASIPGDSATADVAGLAKDPSFRQSGLTGEVNPLPIRKDRARACMVAGSCFSRGEARRAALCRARARVIRAAGRLFFPWGGKRRSAAFVLRGITAAPCYPTGGLFPERRQVAFFRGDWIMGVAGRFSQWVCSGPPHRSIVQKFSLKLSGFAGLREGSRPGFRFSFTAP